MGQRLGQSNEHSQARAFQAKEKNILKGPGKGVSLEYKRSRMTENSNESGNQKSKGDPGHVGPCQ